MEELSPALRSPSNKKSDGEGRHSRDNHKGEIEAASQNLTQV